MRSLSCLPIILLAGFMLVAGCGGLEPPEVAQGTHGARIDPKPLAQPGIYCGACPSPLTAVGVCPHRECKEGKALICELHGFPGGWACPTCGLLPPPCPTCSPHGPFFPCPRCLPPPSGP